MPVARWKQALWLTALLTGCVISAVSHAAMQLDRTRLIVNEAHGRAVIQARSSDTQPLLLQVWIDDGQPGLPHSADTHANAHANQHATAQTAPVPPHVPFITDPPLLRLDAGKRRAIQVLLTATPASLPRDRETLYWLNVLEVPAQRRAVAANTTAATQRLHVSVQSRLKLFYRPQALARYNAGALGPAERLRFALTRDAAGQRWLSIHNPAPIHQSLATLTLHRKSPHGDAALDTPMLAPFETQRLALPPGFSSATLSFATISDDGHLIAGEQAL